MNIVTGKPRKNTLCFKCEREIITDDTCYIIKSVEKRFYCIRCGEKLVTFSFMKRKKHNHDTY
jgi:hypothetical protein